MAGLILESLMRSLLLTLAVELGIAWLIGVRKRKDLALVALVNVLTNPPLVLILDLVYVFDRDHLHWYLIAALELAAVCIEALLYRNRLEFKRISPWQISLLLNGISYFGGWLF